MALFGVFPELLGVFMEELLGVVMEELVTGVRRPELLLGVVAVREASADAEVSKALSGDRYHELDDST